MSRSKKAAEAVVEVEEVEEEVEGDGEEDEVDIDDDEDEVEEDDDDDEVNRGPHVDVTEVPASLVQEDIDYTAPARKKFYLDLINYMARRGTPIKKFPQVARRGLKKKKKKKKYARFNLLHYLFLQILICIFFMKWSLHWAVWIK
jgi:hypothetical protein